MKTDSLAKIYNRYDKYKILLDYIFML